MFVLQAEIILSWYFLRKGQSVEGMHHVARAVSIALSNGLHQFHPPGIDDIDERECIDALWACYVLDRTYVMRYGAEPALDTCGITTPWPMRQEDYEMVCVLFSSRISYSRCVGRA